MKYFDIWLTLFNNFSFIWLKTALPTAIDSGFPPKVDPWVPGIIALDTFFVIKTAPIGKPPPIPLAIGTISGFTLAYSKAKNFPDLPIPHWTSSKINSIFFLLQSFLIALIHQFGMTFIPPSPIMVSIIIAAVFLLINFFNFSWFPNSKWSKPGIFGPNPSVIFFDPLAWIAARVLPWKEFFIQIILFFFGFPIE